MVSAVGDSLSEQITDRYIDGGGNVLDTAEVYAAWLPDGSHRSEEFLGQWLRKHPVFPIVGPKKVADLEESIRAAEVNLTADHLAFLTTEA